MTKENREIERKFLVSNDRWRKNAGTATHILQGYLARGRKATVRVRITDGKAATLTVKSRELGPSRSEFEYRISAKDARALLSLCGRSLIEKQRYPVAYGTLAWEIDVFSGANEGLVLAEVELNNVDDPLVLPPWVGKEVTSDPRYRNSSLASSE